MEEKFYAYSLLETKEMTENEDYVTVKGMATTPSPDRMNDTVDPMGAQFKTPMPLLWQHDSHKPVGTVDFAKPNKSGIPFVAKIPLIKEAGVLKDRVDEAIQSLKYGLVKAVSIGFRGLSGEGNDNYGVDFKEWEWLELSLVTIPANPEAQISMVKSFDKQERAAHGIEESVDEDLTETTSRAWRKGMSIKLNGRILNKDVKVTKK